MTIVIADGRGALWQWDTGRRVKIVGGADVKQIHYQKRCFGHSVDVDVGDDGTAIIPDELLQDYHTLTAYAYVTDDKGGYTKVQQDFAVYKRPKPSDYVYTPTERAGFDKLRDEIGDLADLTTAAKDTLVAAINEAVLYTPQTLTDAQKKQARKNVDAASSDFVINGTLNDDDALTLDKTFAQIQEAVQAGKSAVLKVEVYGIGFVLPLIGESGSGYLFTTAATVFPTVTIQFTAVVGESETVWHTEQVASYDSDGNLVQISMDRDPEQPMEIATKQYVDTHATGGTDMGITGATVGQIAKITAVDENGVPTAWGPVDMPEQVQPDWNQNDDTQPDYVKNRPFYSETKNVTVENVTDAKLDGFPAFVTGATVTVNVDGVEHSLVAYYDEDEGVFTIGDIYSSLENGEGQLGWQFYSDGESYVHFYATEAHTISYLGVFIYKIDDKFVNLDGLVRTYNYYFKDESLYKTLYNSAGDQCLLYTCSYFIAPDLDSQLFGFMSELGFSIVNSVDVYSCFMTGVVIKTINPGIRIVRVVLGTSTSHMETMAADNGYTYTKKPNA